MRRLSVFNQVSLDGFFTDLNNDMSWAHRQDEEFQKFGEENAKGGGELLFGRRTYEMMASFWPTPMAAQVSPVIAEAMNSLPKVVFSRTLDAATWSNTKLVKGDLASEVRAMKEQPGKDMVVMGSGSIVSQLANAGLIDEYQLVLVPIALGQGRSIFEGLESRLSLELVSTRTFQNGNLLLNYEPVR